MSIALGRPFSLGRGPWRTVDPFLFCVYHDDKFPKGGANLGPDSALLRGRELTSDFSYKDGWSMYHGTEVPGFPQHPHRGFETVTVAMKGLVDHFDSMGATGRYGNGDVQWMTAGNGVQHSEMFPLTNDKEPNPLELFQLWLNLPAKSKPCEPHFAMFWAPEVPVTTVGDAEVTVIAGPGLGGATPNQPPPDSWAADANNEVAVWIVRIKKEGGQVTLPPAKNGADINRTVYYFKGTSKTVSVSAAGPGSAPAVALSKAEGLQLDASKTAVISASADGEAEVLILQGRPIKEPVIQHGPFVVNTRDELAKTFSMFHETQFGGWPWPSADYHHPKDQPRFARRPGSKVDEFPPQAKQ